MLAPRLAESGYAVRGAVRAGRAVPAGVTETTVIDDIGPATDWTDALRGVDTVIHAAARAHVLRDSAANEHLYMATNAEGTRRLAQSAAEAGVRRFIFLSSVKVNGEETAAGHAYTGEDEPHPQDVYGESKWLAERYLNEVCSRAPMEHVIVRSPLVYGPHVRANFLRLLRWVDRGVPLPLGSVANQRSLVSIWNLTDLLAHAIENPAAVGRVWMVSDGVDFSTPDLIRAMAHAMGRRATLIPVPVPLLQLAGALLGRGSDVARLCGSLKVDINATRVQLGWNARVTAEEAIRRTVEWYLRQKTAR
jgi:nucleoside-diphosphate-sugar epimerase